ncbi:hypothetical protein HanLR1_Chr12g0435401 [Helianthus annuus]|nr:hypothetical protein HanHA89_Chr12g0457831 [Helianthus annuus]KAJ0674025.1 hypothetical protein HanLR1_Chr12g0435401 [Helianthus annuus]
MSSIYPLTQYKINASNTLRSIFTFLRNKVTIGQLCVLHVLSSQYASVKILDTFQRF